MSISNPCIVQEDFNSSTNQYYYISSLSIYRGKFDFNSAEIINFLFLKFASIRDLNFFDKESIFII